MAKYSSGKWIGNLAEGVARLSTQPEVTQAELLSPLQAARLLNAAPETFEKWQQDGLLIPVTDEAGLGQVYYRIEEVVALQKQLWQSEQLKPSTATVPDPASQIEELTRQLEELRQRQRQLRAEAEIVQSLLQRYKLFSEYASDIILFIEHSGKLLEANNTAVKAYGYTYEELLKLNIQDLRAPSTLSDLNAQLGQAETGAVLFETLHRRKDGSIFPVEVSSQAMQLGEEAIFLSIIRDITERKQAEAEREKLLAQMEAVLLQMPAGVIIAEAPSGRLILGNKQVEEIWRHPFLASSQIENYQEWKGFHLDGRPYQAEEWPLARSITSGEVVADEELIYLRGDATRGILHLDSAPIRDSEGRIIAGVVTFYDITDRKRTEGSLRLLAESSELITSSLNYIAILNHLARLIVPYFADIFIVDLLEENTQLRRAALVHIDPAKEAAMRELTAKHPTTSVLTDTYMEGIFAGNSRFIPNLSQAEMLANARDEQNLELIRQSGPHLSAMIIPLVARGHTLGLISFGTTEDSGRHFDERDLAVAEDLAQRLAIAIDNARLYEAEQLARRAAERAADRTARLQGITATLSEAMTPDQVAEVVVDQGVAALNAKSGVMFTLTPDGQELALVRGIGYPAQILEHWLRFPVTVPAPIAEAVRLKTPIWLKTRDWVERYPDLYVSQAVTGSKALAFIPLLVDNRVLGVIGLSFGDTQEFDEEDRSFMLVLAQQSAQALERARLYEAEQIARTEAEISEKRLAFLAEASKLLASSFDYSVMLESIAHYAVPYLGDVCVVDLLEADESFQRAAVAHVDPAIDEMMHRYLGHYASPPGKVNPLMEVLRRARSVLTPVLTDELLENFARDPEHLAFLRSLGIANSSLVVPLIARGRTLGAMTLATTVLSGRYYSEKDVPLAEDFAHRVAIALDNTRLYHEAQQLAQQLAQQAGQLSAIIDAMPDGVFVSDLQYQMTRVNAKAAEFFGTTIEELLKPNSPINQLNQIRDLDGNFLPGDEMPLALALQGQTGVDFRLIVRRRDTGEDIYLRASYAPICNAEGQIVGAVAVASDITELQRLERQKDEFLGIASHELKTPITTIKGLAQLSLRRLIRTNQLQEVENLRNLDKQLDRLTTLVNDLLDVSRIGTGKLETHSELFDLADLVRRSVKGMQSTTERHQISLDAPDSLEIEGDPDRLDQVLTNLLSNALKYSPEGGLVEVKLVRQDGEALLSVRDHGIGIPPQNREHLFERFYRADNVTEHHISGFGIGLFISNEIVRRQGGRIWLGDLPPDESGTLFYVALPLPSKD